MEPNRNEPDADRSSRYRPHLIVIFAIAMAWFATNLSAGEILPAPMHSIQWDATHSLPPDHPALWKRVVSRPVSVDLTASLSNFDADANPDGWRASVVLRDIDANPVVMRANATFTLAQRAPLVDHHQFIDADDQAISWSMQLRFNEHGVANVTLPLRRSLEPTFGWSSAISPNLFNSASSRSRNNGRYRGGNIAISRVYSGRNRRTVGGISYTRVDVPSTGVMRARISVPTEGIFEAETPVWLRQPNLLSSRSPGSR